jgi:pimeloyl-ACP methyl ester carboxylesterase
VCKHENLPYPWRKGTSEREIGFRGFHRSSKHKGALTFTPTFPTQGVSFDSWKKVFAQYHLDPSCILVGHSAGVPFILNLLEKEEVKAAVLVGGFTKKLENEYDPLVETFLKEFDWEAIKEELSALLSSSMVTMIHSFQSNRESSLLSSLVLSRSSFPMAAISTRRVVSSSFHNCLQQ